MWLDDFLAKLLGKQIFEEEEFEEDGEDLPEVVYWWGDGSRTKDVELQSFIDDQVDVWTQLFQTENEYTPTDEQISAQRLVIDYAFHEAECLSDAIDYMVDSILETEEEDIPEWASNLVKAGIIEYLNGNLKFVQNALAKDLGNA